jgi:hypothetical protein
LAVRGTFGFVPRSLALLLALSLGCQGFQSAGDVAPLDGEAGTRDRAHPGRDAPGADLARDLLRRDGTGPQGPCRPISLPCLDPADAKVIEVPTETAKLQEAFAAAKAGETVQVKGLSVGSGWTIPAFVTLRGCAGAKLAGNVRFAGSGGVVEGFEVSGVGQVVANATGSYLVRFNRFLNGTLSTEAPLSARSIDGLVSADLTLIAESNVFTGGLRAIEAATKYDTGVHSVRLTVRNNIFTGVKRPVEASESGLVGKLELVIEHNTLHAFEVAVSLFGMSGKTLLSGNLLQSGDKGVEGGPFEVQYCMLHQVTNPSSVPPLSGVFASGDPEFVSSSKGDFSLASTSPAIDLIPASAAVPGEDHAGCPRPVAYHGLEARADLGALEARP